MPGSDRNWLDGWEATSLGNAMVHLLPAAVCPKGQLVHDGMKTGRFVTPGVTQHAMPAQKRSMPFLASGTWEHTTVMEPVCSASKDSQNNLAGFPGRAAKAGTKLAAISCRRRW